MTEWAPCACARTIWEHLKTVSKTRSYCSHQSPHPEFMNLKRYEQTNKCSPSLPRTEQRQNRLSPWKVDDITCVSLFYRCIRVHILKCAVSVIHQPHCVQCSNHPDYMTSLWQQFDISIFWTTCPKQQLGTLIESAYIFQKSSALTQHVGGYRTELYVSQKFKPHNPC